MVHLNLILWLTTLGLTFAPAPNGAAKWTAVAGLMIAALLEHSAVRGFFKPKKKNVPGIPPAK